MASLRTRMVILVGVAIAPLFALSIHHAFQKQNTALDRARSDVVLSTRLVALQEERLVEGARQLVNAIDAGPAFKSGDRAPCIVYLQKLRKKYPAYVNIGIARQDGTVVCNSVGTTMDTIKDRRYFKDAIQTGGFVVGDLVTGRATGIPSIHFASTIRDEQDLVDGVAFVALDVRQLHDVRESEHVSPGIAISILDSNGTILSTDRPPPFRVGVSNLDAAFSKGLKETSEQAFVAEDVNGLKRLYALAAVRGTARPGLFVIASVPVEAILAPIRHEMSLELIVLVLFAAAGISAAAWLGSLTIVKPTGEALEKLQEVVGDGTAAPSGKPDRDELDRLTEAAARAAEVVRARKDVDDSLQRERQRVEERLEAVQQVGKVGDWELEIATGALRWSDQTYVIFAVEKLAFSNTYAGFLELVHPDDREHFETMQLAALSGHAPLDVKHRLIHSGTRERWVHEMGHLEFDASGRPVKLVGTVLDISERKHAEAQLILLATAAGHLNDMILVTEGHPLDEPGPRIIYVNDAFARHTGYTKDEALGKTPRILQGPLTQRSELDRIRLALSKGQAVQAELINYTKTGQQLWLELDIVPIRDGEGWPRQWVSIQRNITERKQQQALLAHAQQQTALVLGSVASGIVGIDTSYTIQFINASAERIMGWEPGEAIGRSALELLQHHHPDGRECRPDECPILATLTDGDVTVEREVVFLHRKGERFPVEYIANPMRDPDGEVIGAVISFTDVTNELLLKERLRQSQRLESVGHLTGGVAHDFNNLLTVILGNSELLSELLEGQPKLAELSNMVTDAALRGARLTQHLLAFARQQPLEPTVVDVNQLIADFDGLLRKSVGEHIDVVLILSSNVWQAMIDPTQLESALLNLCVNSRHAMPDGGRLTIETDNVYLDAEYAELYPDLQAGPYIMVAVSDTGCGIAPENLARVFDPFFTTRGKGEGTGLGLSMVYGFIKQSRGHINIYSEPGFGTSVKMYLPMATRDAAARNEHIETQLGGGTETILLVEDDDLVRRYAYDQLTALGYTVIQAENGPVALEKLAEHDTVDLLFTDVVMPGDMTGRQLADAARGLRPALKVLYTSGYTENAIVHHGRLDPGVHLLVKPYRHKELTIAIRRALDSNDPPPLSDPHEESA